MSTPLASLAAGLRLLADGLEGLEAPQDGAVTIKAAAQSLGVSKAHIYQQARAGAIKVLRIGRSVRIPAQELESFRRKRMRG